jgi:transposase InsO family protein
MNLLYQSIGITKQSFHQYVERSGRRRNEELQLLKFIYDIREDHPTLGARDMYFKIQPSCMGRDAFELFCKEEGLGSKRKINYRRTTDSTGVERFPNLIESLEITTINEVWQSDITYYEIGNRFYFITFILDAYSRRIVGHSVSKRLFTEQTTLPALEMAIKVRRSQNLQGLIFHSDGGGQYYDHAFLNLTGNIGIKNSMCEYAWENGKAERINGVIKNNYLRHRNIQKYEDLIKEVDRSVLLYNTEKPHIRLQRKSPIQFENLYFYNGQKTGGEKSTTELKIHSQEGLYSPSDCGQKTNGSNITLELKNKLSNNQIKTVNVI